MKKNRANGLAATVTRTPLKKLTRNTNVSITGTIQLQQSGLTEVRKIAPPSEDLVNRLNAMGKEYPFCVINKPGNHLIL